MTELRKRPVERITGVIWGLIVTGAAVTAMYALSGTEVDMTNVAIVALVVLGGWLVVSALVSTRPRSPKADPYSAYVQAEVEAEIAGSAEPAIAPEPEPEPAPTKPKK